MASNRPRWRQIGVGEEALGAYIWGLPPLIPSFDGDLHRGEAYVQGCGERCGRWPRDDGWSSVGALPVKPVAHQAWTELGRCTPSDSHVLPPGGSCMCHKGYRRHFDEIPPLPMISRGGCVVVARPRLTGWPYDQKTRHFFFKKKETCGFFIGIII